LRISDRGLRTRVLQAMGDLECTELLHAIRSDPKTAQILAGETGIPLSSVYRKLAMLRGAGLAITSYFRLTNEGKREDFLISGVTEVRIEISGGDIEVDLVPTGQNATRIWLELFKG